MPNNITRLLPSSFPTQNTHRHVVFNADTQPDELARMAILTADAIAAARAAVRAYEEDPILPESLGITFARWPISSGSDSFSTTTFAKPQKKRWSISQDSGRTTRRSNRRSTASGALSPRPPRALIESRI